MRPRGVPQGAVQGLRGFLGAGGSARSCLLRQCRVSPRGKGAGRSLACRRIPRIPPSAAAWGGTATPRHHA
eukprot:15122406-Alexandrium_andersonii.AAC.1